MNINEIKKHILTLCNGHPKPNLILGLSGGPDSVFLFHILKDMHQEGTISLVATHLDHEWRATSTKDALFCEALAQSFNIPFIKKCASEITPTKKIKSSKEALGRHLRRIFFVEALHQYQAQAIVLAHHADDQQETFLIRLIRGATLDGLCAMKEKTGHYIRPLLSIYKKDILAYLNNQNLDYCIDETNESCDYLRNRIRKEVIPALRSCDERFDTTFFTTLDSLQKENEYLKKISRELFETVFKNRIGSLNRFKHLDEVVQKRIILQMLIQEGVQFSISTSFINEILHFIQSERGGKHILNNHWSIIKKSDEFYIEKNKGA